MEDQPSYGGCEGLLMHRELPEPMDVSTYDSILAMKGMPRGLCVDELESDEPLLPYEDKLFPTAGASFTVPEKMLREDLAANKVCWYGDLRKDLWEFSKNANPLFALWYSHPLHPIARTERIVITVAQVLFLMMLTMTVPRAEHCFKGGFVSCAEPVDLIYDVEADYVADQDFCCLTERIGLMWCLRNIGIEWGGAVYAFVANVIFGQVLFQAGANCCCVQRQRKWVRVTCESIGHILILTICILCCIPLPKFIQYCIVHAKVAWVVYTFLTCKIGGMVGTSIFQTIVWYICWCQQCPANAEGYFCGIDFAPSKKTNMDCKECGFNVTVLDYQALIQRLGSHD